MAEEQTWRDVLGTITSDPHERQRIADIVKINPITLVRWTNGKSNPRPDTLRLLLDALPDHRTRLAELIVKEFPDFFSVEKTEEQELQEIPSAFYAHVLGAYTTSPPQLRAPSVCMLVLQQILSHLDPQQQGLLVIVAQCVAPEAGQKVRSLRQTLARGTGQWGTQFGSQTRFLGAESQSGHAVITGHPIITQSHEERMRLFPSHQTDQAQSTASYPILLGDRIAGSLSIISTEPDYFTLSRLNLIQNYTDLMVLAFDRCEFYALRNVELAVMPPYSAQVSYLASFQKRVTQHLIQAAQDQQQLTRPQAELIAWREVELELLHHSLP